MNRHQRRAAKSNKSASSGGGSHSLKLSIISVHEVGHAYGRWITADKMGMTPAEAVYEIEIKEARDIALTYGMMFSREITQATHAVSESYGMHLVGTHVIDDPSSSTRRSSTLLVLPAATSTHGQRRSSSSRWLAHAQRPRLRALISRRSSTVPAQTIWTMR
jgi:hypothetical protein